MEVFSDPEDGPWKQPSTSKTVESDSEMEIESDSDDNNETATTRK